jgi:DNA uptake protein ComE-like DNA-binding protein
MRRALVLIAAGSGLILASMAWLAGAQLGVPVADPALPAIQDVPDQGSAQAPVKPKVDLNRAGMEELRRLPGITPEIAQRIVRNRPYRKLDDLVTRKVLGKKQFARVRELVMVGPVTP